ncbi:GDAP2 [Cordylochernes scorpioides]|uniref:GDAP2 n=1 Tax=Cordylochernes scorpioides TaxID=51811 RepID=A0ABY6L7T0_9ARAC|nr:GDAP2 [Cordylochernes scorpioides]
MDIHTVYCLIFRKVGGRVVCRTGDAKLSKGYNLPARHVIHTVGPKYNAKYHTAAESALFSCYQRVFQIVSIVTMVPLPFDDPLAKLTTTGCVPRWWIREQPSGQLRKSRIILINKQSQINRGIVRKRRKTSLTRHCARRVKITHGNI